VHHCCGPVRTSPVHHGHDFIMVNEQWWSTGRQRSCELPTEVCHLSQSSKSALIGFLRDVCSIGLKVVDQALFKHWVNNGCQNSPCLHAHNCISNSAIRRTNFENGDANGAIVVLCLVWTTSWNFKFVEKWWADALLNVKCCCSVQKPLWKSHAILN